MTEEMKQLWREHFEKYKIVSMTERSYKYFKMADIDLSAYEQAVNDNGTYWKLK